MFIETVMSTTRAPAERNVSGNCVQFHFAPLERGGYLAGRAFYKHFVPTGREPGDKGSRLKKTRS